MNRMWRGSRTWGPRVLSEERRVCGYIRKRTGAFCRLSFLFFSVVLLSVGCGTLFRPATHAPSSAIGFSADMIVTIGGATSTSRIMSAGEKLRLEVPGGRRSSIMIARYDLDKLWVLISSAAKYKEFPLDSMGMQFPHFFMPGLEIEKEEAGHERIGSIWATKYRARIRMCGRVYEGYLWEARDLPGYPLQWEDEKRRTVVRWRNGRITAISHRLFDIPDGFTELPSSTRLVAGRENRCRKQRLRNQGP